MHLDQLAAMSSVRGVRCLRQDEELGFATRPDFIGGMRLLAEYDLSFDICIRHFLLPAVVELVEQCPDVRFLLDHIGKSGIKAREIDAWHRNYARLMYGSDWPVVRLATTYHSWWEALTQLVSREEADQKRLFYGNTKPFYRV